MQQQYNPSMTQSQAPTYSQAPYPPWQGSDALVALRAPTHKLEVYYNGKPCLQGLSINTGPYAHAVRDRDLRPNYFKDAYDPMHEARLMPTDHSSMTPHLDSIHTSSSPLMNSSEDMHPPRAHHMVYPLDRSIAGPFLRSYMALPHFASQY